jgi:hypothetical protein
MMLQNLDFKGLQGHTMDLAKRNYKKKTKGFISKF